MKSVSNSVRAQLWTEWSVRADADHSVGKWCATFREMGFFYVHYKLSIAEALRGDLPSRSSVVSRRPLTEPLLVVRRSPDWRRPSWAFNRAGADSGCTSVTLADERSVLWSAVVKPGGVLAIGSNHPDGDQGLMVERTESAIGPLLVGTDSTAEVFVDPRYLTRVQRST